jgi:hypothetical protein
MGWTMKCELCAGKFTTDDVDLVYRHAFEVHGVELDDLRTASLSPINVGGCHYRYQLPDGRIWLDAVKS